MPKTTINISPNHGNLGASAAKGGLWSGSSSNSGSTGWWPSSFGQPNGGERTSCFPLPGQGNSGTPGVEGMNGSDQLQQQMFGTAMNMMQMCMMMMMNQMSGQQGMFGGSNFGGQGGSQSGSPINDFLGGGNGGGGGYGGGGGGGGGPSAYGPQAGGGGGGYGGGGVGGPIGYAPQGGGGGPVSSDSNASSPASSPMTGNPSTPLAGDGSNQYDQLIQQAAQKYNLDPNLLKSVIKQESGFNANAQSPAGAQGLMQLMPATAKEMGVTNAMDPAQSIDAGARYLAQQLKTFNGDVSKALAAYNAGAGNVMKYNGVPPFAETQNYVKSITADYAKRTALAGGKGA